MIYALLSKNVASRIYSLSWVKLLRVPGLEGGGGQSNLGNALYFVVRQPIPNQLMKNEGFLYCRFSLSPLMATLRAGQVKIYNVKTHHFSLSGVTF